MDHAVIAVVVKLLCRRVHKAKVEVGDPKISCPIHKDITGLDVTVNDTDGVKICNTS